MLDITCDMAQTNIVPLAVAQARKPETFKMTSRATANGTTFI